MMEKMKNGLHKFREVNHKEHRRQMYEQWGNKIISKINMWENSKEFKSINVLLKEETTTKRYCLSGFYR